MLLSLLCCRKNDTSRSDISLRKDSVVEDQVPHLLGNRHKGDTVLKYGTGLVGDRPNFSPRVLKESQVKFLNELVKNGEGEFETDTTYSIKEITCYAIDEVDTIFYVKGEFMPSTSEFHFYGGYNQKHSSFDIYHLPVETTFSYTRFELTTEFLHVYGQLADDNSEDRGEIKLFKLQR